MVIKIKKIKMQFVSSTNLVFSTRKNHNFRFSGFMKTLFSHEIKFYKYLANACDKVFRLFSRRRDVDVVEAPCVYVRMCACICINALWNAVRLCSAKKQVMRPVCCLAARSHGSCDPVLDNYICVAAHTHPHM